MKVIPHMHAFVSELSAEAQAAFMALSIVRHLGKGEAVYRQGDQPEEIYRIVEGGVKLCNYSLDGKEVTAGELRPNDCFGEMGVLDELPRVSCAVATRDSVIRVLSRERFEELVDRYPEVMRKLAVMMCRRVRFLYALNEEAVELTLHQRVARTVLRMAYSCGPDHARREVYIAISQEELGQMLGASRQSVNKELKRLQAEHTIDLRYGRIYIRDFSGLKERYEYLLGTEQITPGYEAESR